VIKTAACDKFTYKYFFDRFILQVIPAVDLMQGLVMHAKFGLRSHYQPLTSCLCFSAVPVDIITGLLELYPFKTVYIADLDAILGTGNQQHHIEEISEKFPDLTIWLDCGIRQPNARALYLGGNIRPVVGSENVANLQDYRAISYGCQSRHVLSLDYHSQNEASGAMGISELHDSARFWPDDAICMTLNTVGSAQGVDTARLNELIALNNARKSPSRLYASGGARNIQDIQELKPLGISGVLVATALHNGSISAQDLVDLHHN
jgi:phosphoribosylformimino-5-aminoimidazole carboxamide ribotide isomerase